VGSLCPFDGCANLATRRGWCDPHYEVWRVRSEAGSRKGRRVLTCSFKGCDRRHKVYGWCDAHSRQAANGGPLRPIRTRRAHRMVTRNGYVKIYDPGHPNAQKRGWIFEHIRVMADHLGRPLLPEENVHHRNGVRGDNRLGNLELWTRSHPSGGRVDDKVAWAVDMIRLYRPDLTRGWPTTVE
jgi:hypothetical protein